VIQPYYPIKFKNFYAILDLELNTTTQAEIIIESGEEFTVEVDLGDAATFTTFTYLDGTLLFTFTIENLISTNA
jgi:hypothetical protein